ncbi:MAG: hypothetical protein JWP69_434 [Flaviaesturariibacter sp.]|nr:hypothetical protein [Flaviaesturariibacter sp.]
MKLPIFLALSTLCLLLSSVNCKKSKTVTRTELDKLPPITQEGKNTIGFLVNGQAWTPRGFQFQPNFYIIADPSFFGNLDIRAYRLIGQQKESISINCFDITTTGIYPINGITRIFINYRSEPANCFFLNDSTNYKSGFLKISKYDLQNGIVAGEFEVKLFDATISCDTIRITNGRFDYKL